MPSDRELKRIQRLAKLRAKEANETAAEIESIQLNQSEDSHSPGSSGSAGMISTDLELESNADMLEDNQEKAEAGGSVQSDGMETELLVESMLEPTHETQGDELGSQVDGSGVSSRVDDDNWSLSDDTDSVDLKLVWLEAHNCQIHPGPNTITLHGQVCFSL